jgi:GT2 family glycosyltransferase
MGDRRQLFFCAVKFCEEYSFNGSIYDLLLNISGSRPMASLIAKTLLGLSLFAGYVAFHPQRNRHLHDDPLPGCFFALGAVFVLSPTVHIWYLAWILPFLPLRPMASWCLLSLTMGVWYITVGIQHETGEWRLPLIARLFEWLPFWILLLREGYLLACRRHTVVPETSSTVSVIIPAQNEETRIGDCIRSVREDAAVSEIIVVDGGSTDRTRERAAEAGARVCRHDRGPGAGGGRGGQIHAGLLAATGDVVAVVHADMRVGFPWFSHMTRALQGRPDVIGGALGARFDGRGPMLRLIEYVNDFRAAYLGISFGDQIQFFRREPVMRAGMFPDMPLMEDVELSLRLPRLGRMIFLFGGALVSARNWQTGRLKRSLLIFRLLSSYLWQRLWRKTDATGMYRQYYDASDSPLTSSESP